MEIKGLVISAGIGMLAGATAAMLLPKHSEAYRIANQASKTIQMEAGKLMDAMKRQ